ncbi:MAG: VTT domain-containing protein [bacterium]
MHNYVAINPLLSPFIFILFFSILTSLALPVGALFLLLSGYLFPTFLASLYSMISLTLSGLVLFICARYFFRDYFFTKFYPLYCKINDSLQSQENAVLFILRCVPVLPFFLVSIFLGLSKVNLVKYLLFTSFGMYPIIYIYSMLGKRLVSLSSLQDLFSPEITIIILCVFAISMLGIMFRSRTLRR